MTLSRTSRIIQISNSQGIRIPKALLQQLGFVDEVTLEVQENQPLDKGRLIKRLGRLPDSAQDATLAMLTEMFAP